eukprot:2306706-Prymnesium_polylepis.1
MAAGPKAGAAADALLADAAKVNRCSVARAHTHLVRGFLASPAVPLPPCAHAGPEALRSGDTQGGSGRGDAHAAGLLR